MNINQIEQALRNLIASQPMIASGPSGDVINSITNIIDAFKNLNFRVQTHPNQDSLKFALQNDCAKAESDICNFVVGVLQERGINIMLYLPAQNSPYSGFSYGMGAGQGYVPGQMMYSQNMPVGQNVGFGGTFVQQPIGNQMGQQIAPQNQSRPAEVIRKPKLNETEENADESAFDKAVEESSFDELESTNIVKKTDAPESKPEEKEKKEEKKETKPAEKKNANLEQKPIKTGVKPAGSSNGRDYLLELLKR